MRSGHPVATARARHVLVVGAGPAGLAAARAVLGVGAQATVLEHAAEVGLRLAATGGGRCNIGNNAPGEAFMAAFGRAGRHMVPALRAFGLDGLRGMLRDAGVGLVSPDGFHLYPDPPSARGLRDALRDTLRRRGADLRTGAQVAELLFAGGRCAGVRLADGTRLEADAVVLATGGAAVRKLGADGSGYDLARQAGHGVRGPFPALVPLATSEPWAAELAGVSLADVELRASAPALRRSSWRGALLFTHRGISGPVVLDASGAIAEALATTGGPVPIRLDLSPPRTSSEWLAVSAAWRERHGARMLPALLAGTVPASVAAVLARLCGIDGAPCSHWTRDGHAALARHLAELPLTVVATEGFEAAMATRGGIPLREVAPQTLGSRLTAGLFLAGEILDLDGPCGGYNLLWAFSAGHLAGAAAATSAEHETGS